MIRSDFSTQAYSAIQAKRPTSPMTQAQPLSEQFQSDLFTRVANNTAQHPAPKFQGKGKSHTEVEYHDRPNGGYARSKVVTDRTGRVTSHTLAVYDKNHKREETITFDPKDPRKPGKSDKKKWW